jgi:hypothetical protein
MRATTKPIVRVSVRMDVHFPLTLGALREREDSPQPVDESDVVP